jgi:hypothetical protein
MEARLEHDASMTEERPLVAAMRVNEDKKATNPNPQLWGGRYV